MGVHPWVVRGMRRGSQGGEGAGLGVGLRIGEGALGTKAKGGHPEFKEKVTFRCYMGAP